MRTEDGTELRDDLRVRRRNEQGTDGPVVNAEVARRRMGFTGPSLADGGQEDLLLDRDVAQQSASEELEGLSINSAWIGHGPPQDRVEPLVVLE